MDKLTKEDFTDNFYMKFREKFIEYKLPAYDIDRERMVNELIRFGNEYQQFERPDNDPGQGWISVPTEILEALKAWQEYDARTDSVKAAQLHMKGRKALEIFNSTR